jgi:phage baseplate assembly protein gpV
MHLAIVADSAINLDAVQCVMNADLRDLQGIVAVASTIHLLGGQVVKVDMSVQQTVEWLETALKAARSGK